MSTHETLIREEVIEPGSDRSFGLVVGGVLGAIGAYQLVSASAWYLWFLAPGAMLIVLGLFAPRVLRPLNVGWTRLGLLLGRVITPIVMFLIYAISVVPTAIALRLAGKDLLQLKPRPDQSSYWHVREPPGPPPESLRDQF
jgi:hypothetical protein